MELWWALRAGAESPKGDWEESKGVGEGMGSQRGGAARAREGRRFPQQHTGKTGGSPVRVGEARERSARELRKGVSSEDGERHSAKRAHGILS